MVLANGASRRTLQGSWSSQTEGSARPQGGRYPVVVATLSRRGSNLINRHANGDIAPALGGGRARPGGTSCLDSGRARTSEQVAV